VQSQPFTFSAPHRRDLPACRIVDRQAAATPPRRQDPDSEPIQVPRRRAVAVPVLIVTPAEEPSREPLFRPARTTRQQSPADRLARARRQLRSQAARLPSDTNCPPARPHPLGCDWPARAPPWRAVVCATGSTAMFGSPTVSPGRPPLSSLPRGFVEKIEGQRQSGSGLMTTDKRLACRSKSAIGPHPRTRPCAGLE